MVMAMVKTTKNDKVVVSFSFSFSPLSPLFVFIESGKESERGEREILHKRRRNVGLSSPLRKVPLT